VGRILHGGSDSRAPCIAWALNLFIFCACRDKNGSQKIRELYTTTLRTSTFRRFFPLLILLLFCVFLWRVCVFVFVCRRLNSVYFFFCWRRLGVYFRIFCAFFPRHIPYPIPPPPTQRTPRDACARCLGLFFPLHPRGRCARAGGLPVTASYTGAGWCRL